MTEFDFSAYDPAGKTAIFNVPIRGALIPREREHGEPELAPGEKPELVEGQPTLTMKHAGDSNRPYMNGVARTTAKMARGRRKAPTAEQITARVKEDRDQDRELFPEFVITSWENMPSAGTRAPAPFTRAACRDFCAKVPDWIFDRMRAFAGNPVNFVDDDKADMVLEEQDVEEHAGN